MKTLDAGPIRNSNCSIAMIAAVIGVGGIFMVATTTCVSNAGVSRKPTSQPSETKKTESGTSIDSYSEENDPWHAYPGGPDAWWYSPFSGEWERKD